MAQRGRKPVPTAIKELEGNPGHRPLNPNEPKPLRKAPACPKWLSDDAKREWRRLVKKLEALGVLTELDMAVFATYCDAFAKWKEADEFLTQRGLFFITPSGYPQQFPQVAIAQNYAKLMNRCAEQLGLTPSARSRIYYTYNLLLKDGWRMNEIDSMDMLGFLRVRAWDARREYDKTHTVPRKVFIDEVWPKGGT